ncbi:hypothetical protein [Streptomyces sp. NPDC002328]|uniref:VMAP-C domain-containing protein n=1 Tax=Streptomyces sp. NPDC002328 TaxID=3364642 RepID=UPI0036B0B56B
MATHRFDEVQLDLIAGMVAVLEEPNGGLMREDGRQLWRRLVHDTVEQLPQDTYGVPHQEFVSVVRACAAREGALTHLGQVTKLVSPGLDRHLQPLLDEWRAHGVYGARSWYSLREALDRRLTGPADLPTLMSRSTGGRRILPPYCLTPWQAFTHLADANAPSSGLPPSMVLLEHLARHPELSAFTAELRSWNDHFATEWGLLNRADGLLSLRASLETSHARELSSPSRQVSETSPPHERVIARDEVIEPRNGAGGPSDEPAVTRLDAEAPPGRRTIDVYIKVTPDHAPQATAGGRRRSTRKPRYHVSACVKYWDSLKLYRPTGTESDTPVTREQLGACFSELLTRMAPLWHDRSEVVALEFFLPLDLLAEPVEWWDRDPTRRFANPLLGTHQVSVHSLERVQRPALHNPWRMRWAYFKKNAAENAADRESAKNVVHECPADPLLSDDVHLGQLYMAVGSDSDVAALILCEAPLRKGELGLEEMGLALDLGVPVLLYRRENSAAEAWRAAVREALADAGLSGVALRAQRWKTDTAAGRSVPHAPATIRAMGLVWDDPEYLLDGGPSAPATFVGGTE